jgi:hypothetical protein
MSLVEQAIQQLRSGSSSPTTGGQQATGAQNSTTASSEPVTRSEDLGVTVVGEDTQDTAQPATESVLDLLGDSGDGETQSDSPATAAAKAAKAQGTPDGQKEFIFVTDESGKRRKVEIDYNDRASVKKAFELMHGSRKWQAERDRAITQQKEASEKAARYEKLWSAMERAYEEAGELGVLDLIGGKQGAAQEFLKKQYERQKFLENASEKEIAELQQRERLERLERELEKERKAKEEWTKKMEQERETAELRSLESRVNPTFEKYRFDGRLGNADDEAMFDEMLWNTTMKRLEPYEARGEEITRELVEREFRTVATAIRKRISGLAEKTASVAVEKKKQEALTNAQAASQNAYRKGGIAKEAGDMLRSGNLRGLFENWGKFGGKK